MNYDDISKEICRLAELSNNWSSTIIIPQSAHSSISVQLLKGNFLLLLMVQLISLMSIPKESLHPYIALIQICSVKMTGQN